MNKTIILGLCIILSLISFCNGQRGGRSSSRDSRSSSSSNSDSSCDCPLSEWKGESEDFNSDGSCKHCSTCSSTNGDSTCKCPSEDECNEMWTIVGVIFAAVVVLCCACGCGIMWRQKKQRRIRNANNSTNNGTNNNNVTARTTGQVPMQTVEPKKVITYNPDFKAWTPEKVAPSAPQEGQDDAPPEYEIVAPPSAPDGTYQ